MLIQVFACVALFIVGIGGIAFSGPASAMEDVGFRPLWLGPLNAASFLAAIGAACWGVFLIASAL